LPQRIMRRKFGGLLPECFGEGVNEVGAYMQETGSNRRK
jgi:hypothetical protein